MDKLSSYLRWFSLIILPLALFLAFDEPALPDSAYAMLLGDETLQTIGIENLKMLALASLIVSLILVYWTFSEQLAGWTIAILLALSPGVISNTVFLISPRENFVLVLSIVAIAIFHKMKGYQKMLLLLPLAAVIYLLLPHAAAPSIDAIISNMLGMGMLLPLALLTLLLVKEKEEPGIYWLLAGVVLATVSYSLGLAAVILAAARGLQAWLKKPEQTVWVSGIVATTALYLLSLTSQEYLMIAIVAIGAGILAHLVLSLYKLQYSYSGLAIISLILINLMVTQITVEKQEAEIPSTEMLEAFEVLASQQGEVTMLKFNNSFTYYTGKEALQTTGRALLGEEPLETEYFLFSTQGLMEALAHTSRVFVFVQKEVAPEGTQILFINEKYALVAQVSSDEKEVVNAVMFDRVSGQQASVPFTKLRPLDNDQPLTQQGSLLIHTDGIEESLLYDIVTGEEYIYQNDGVYVVKTNG